MAERLSLYEYLSFVLPGGAILFVAVYGYDGWPRGEPGPSAAFGLLAAAFIVGYVNAAIGNWFEAVFLGSRPGSRPDPLWGTLGASSHYSDEDRASAALAITDRYGEGTSLKAGYRLAYTELQQRGLAGHLALLNQHIGFSRGMATASAIGLAVETGLVVTCGSHLEPLLWLPLLAVATGAFVARYRRFWFWFGDNVLRGVRTLPPK